MSARTLLIDGYNLLHAAGMGQAEYRRGDLLRCRLKLMRHLLSKLAPAEVQKTTIIFDARDPPPDRPARAIVSGLTVLFANPGGDADVAIKNWLATHSSPRQVTLVSSDRELQRAARQCGARFSSSEDFLIELDRRRGRRPAARDKSPTRTDDSKPSPRVTATETAHWLKVFGEVPVVEVEIEIAGELSSPLKGSEPRTTTTPKHQTGRQPQRRPRPSDAPAVFKPSESDARDELGYWLKIFSDLPAGATSASADELRLTDLEKWLEQSEGEIEG